MSKKIVSCLLMGMLLGGGTAYSQSADSVAGKIINFPSKFFDRIRGKTASLDDQLTKQTEKYLAKMAKREERIKNKLFKIDSTAAKSLFNNSAAQYASLIQRLRSDTGGQSRPLTGQYQPYADSLKTSLAFLQQNPQVLEGTASAGLATTTSGLMPAGSDLTGKLGSLDPQLQAKFSSSMSQLQTLQAKMQDADQIQQYVQSRKQQIKDYLSHYTALPGGLSNEYQGLNQDLYYYTQQVQSYKDMLNDPDKLEKKALSLISELPAFQLFMKNNSQLATLFGLPGNAGSGINTASSQALTGLPTRDQMQQLVQGQLSQGGESGLSSMQSSLQSAQNQLNQYTDKVSKLGAGGGDVDIPNFKPDEQKTKTFWKRLEYGTNMQTTKASYNFPTTTDLGLSLGYKLGGSNTVGVGASYKIGWGSGWDHIQFSNQGIGLRSYLDIKIKGSFFATGGLEYNYQTPFTSLQQIRHLNSWSQSGLLGVSKTVSVKSRVFKKTKLSLLWDFLSYQQVPKTQPILFRVGYNF